MNVLSLFDGMSCGQQALERIGIKVDKYFASEIDKYAIKVTMANYPNTIQLGSVTEVNGYDLPKIDLLIGGSPCQSFSFAGKRKGMSTKDEQEILTLEHYLELKQQEFEFEGQSYLFWEFMRLLNEVKPKYFLLENVIMTEKWEKVLTNAIGVNPIEINSALVSAQNRRRLYWTNIGMKPQGLFGFEESIIEQPKDKKILLKDILEKEVDEKYFLKENFKNDRLYKTLSKNELKKVPTFIDSYNKTIHTDKSQTISTRVSASNCSHIYDPETIIINKYPHLEKADGKNNLLYHRKGFKTNTQTYGIYGKCGTLDTAQGGGRNAHILLNESERKVKQISQNNKSNGGTQPYQQDRIYDVTGISPALSYGKSDLMIMLESENEFKRKIICHEMQEMVNVRKYDVDTEKLKKCLKDNKKFSNQEISDKLNISKTTVDHWFRSDKHFSIPDKDIWFELKKILEIETNEFDESITTFIEKENTFEKANRIYDENGISPTLTSSNCDEKILTENKIRRLTPVECERLQTIKDNYTAHVSDSQRYKMLGNGWTVDVISHIFSYLEF